MAKQHEIDLLQMEMDQPHWLSKQEENRVAVVEEKMLDWMSERLNVGAVKRGVKYNEHHDRLGRFASGEGATMAPDTGTEIGGGSTSGRGTGQEHLRQALEKIEKEIKSKEKEEVHVYDPDGNELYSVKGGATHVELSPQQLFALKGNVLTHNHPGVSDMGVTNNDIPLSGSDVKTMMLYKAKEVRAVCKDAIYVARPSKRTPVGDVKEANDLDRYFTGSFRTKMERFRLELCERLRKGEITERKMRQLFIKQNTIALQEAWKEMASMFYLELERIPL